MACSKRVRFPPLYIFKLFQIYEDYRPIMFIVPALNTIIASLLALCFVGNNVTSQLNMTKQFCYKFMSVTDEGEYIFKLLFIPIVKNISTNLHAISASCII